ncbi:site-specific DNA-methyltransferase [Pseudoluteimonas lycopersici]|uniref:Site-specific DNA-methyltransferase n=1 Tax=Pseudoluteimonas lycopersici TaxID=1324796 RepID=A0A516V566_9GAMM|nr:site-specific DNA-methyltransferase [Lysobacter lycopersici]QDQ73676.1 site-specific DNA-methyltransferase [Lysobacter lycopersici]
MPLLSWHNRDQDLTRAALAPYRLLEPVTGLSYGEPDAPNMLIEGDNLDALKALLPYYAGQVKCVFIDPPYNTGSAFDHYDDNLEHSTWLSTMYPRLELLKQLLAKDGHIFVQIDDNEMAYLQVVMDEIFGRPNRAINIAVKMSELSGVKMKHVDRKPPKLKEYILGYRATPAGRLRPVKKAKNPENLEKYLRYYTNFIENPEDDVEEWVVTSIKEHLLSEGVEPTEENIREFQLREAERVVYRTNNALLARQKFHTRTAKVISPTGIEYVWWEGKQMLFLSSYTEEYLGDFWPDISTINLNKEGGVDFKRGKKPETLLQRILEMCTSESDLVLDSFLGSGTTAAVAHKMGRRWIGIEMGDHARTHCQPRLKKVVDGEQGGISEAVGWKGGSGFRFYKLGVPVFDQDGHIDERIKFEQLAAHVWFAETGTPRSTRAKKDAFLGEHGGTGYYLLFNGILGDERKTGGNVLTRRVLRSLAKFDGPKVIYGEACDLSAEQLRELDIAFRQTPYDIQAR